MNDKRGFLFQVSEITGYKTHVIRFYEKNLIWLFQGTRRGTGVSPIKRLKP